MLRYARLGLYAEMMRSLGRSPDIAEHNAECARRGRRGETWDPAGTLIDAYWHWNNVTRAAVRFYEQGGGGGVPASYAHANRGDEATPPYLHHEVLWAIKRCRKALGGVWPSRWEYLTWRS